MHSPSSNQPIYPFSINNILTKPESGFEPHQTQCYPPSCYPGLDDTPEINPFQWNPAPAAPSLMNTNNSNNYEFVSNNSTCMTDLSMLTSPHLHNLTHLNVPSINNPLSAEELRVPNPSTGFCSLNTSPSSLYKIEHHQHHPQQFSLQKKHRSSSHEDSSSYNKVTSSSSTNEPVTCDSSGTTTTKGGKIVKRKPRKLFSTQQIAAMQEIYHKQQYVNASERENLSGKTGLTSTQVKIWFQNHRYKCKKKRETNEIESVCTGTQHGMPRRAAVHLLIQEGKACRPTQSPSNIPYSLPGPGTYTVNPYSYTGSSCSYQIPSSVGQLPSVAPTAPSYAAPPTISNPGIRTCW